MVRKRLRLISCEDVHFGLSNFVILLIKKKLLKVHISNQQFLENNDLALLEKKINSNIELRASRPVLVPRLNPGTPRNGSKDS